jgi:hypothetical protein
MVSRGDVCGGINIQLIERRVRTQSTESDKLPPEQKPIHETLIHIPETNARNKRPSRSKS